METKSFKEIMQDLGFNEDASYEAKKAFLKHLFKTANQQEHNLEKAKASKRASTIVGQQLSLFDFKEEKSA